MTFETYRRMEQNTSQWNGYAVNGEVKELDRIAESEGFINLDKDDIIATISADGENYITTGSAANLGEAFNAALANIPVSIEKIDKLLIQFCCGSRQPEMAEISKISPSLTSANDRIVIQWGLSSDTTLGEAFKVILLASVTQ